MDIDDDDYGYFIEKWLKTDMIDRLYKYKIIIY